MIQSVSSWLVMAVFRGRQQRRLHIPGIVCSWLLVVLHACVHLHKHTKQTISLGMDESCPACPAVFEAPSAPEISCACCSLHCTPLPPTSTVSAHVCMSLAFDMHVLSAMCPILQHPHKGPWMREQGHRTPGRESGGNVGGKHRGLVYGPCGVKYGATPDQQMGTRRGMPFQGMPHTWCVLSRPLMLLAVVSRAAGCRTLPEVNDVCNNVCQESDGMWDTLLQM